MAFVFVPACLDHLVAPILRQFKYMCCLDSNITELEAQLEMFQRTRQGVQLWVDSALADLRIIDPNVEAWLRSANEVTSEIEGILQEKPRAKEGCLNGWCPNLKLRYSLSRKAVKKTKVVLQLQAEGISYTQTDYSLPPASVEIIPNRDFMRFESRRLSMEEIIEALKHDEIKLIGICGMGGTGKTTIVKEVAKRAKEDGLFDEVAMVVVGQEPNLTNVQACIAEMLGLKELCDTSNPIVRADLLRARLSQDNKKILVILDDIWAEMDLEVMGFPLRGAYKNSKMLYTSRIRYLWHYLQIKKEIPLELLSEDEAWQLFREEVGDLADAHDLQPIAKKIANKCGRLPLALVYVGATLSKKGGRNIIKELWEHRLDMLTCASNTHDKMLYSHLELSYEYLNNEEAKRLFWLCCLFKEDENIRIEDLARYGFKLSFFDGIKEMEKVRYRVLLIVEDLKRHYLLLDSEEEECVKVLNIVRNMGIYIASKDKCAIVSHGAASKWPKTVKHQHCTAISVISEKIKELPEGLTYPNLEFLMLRCHKLEKLPPNLFEGMRKLKVLELKNFHGILTFQPLKNLTTLALEGFCGMLDNVRVIGDLLNLEILNFRDSGIKELPEEIRELVNLRLLDLRGTSSLERIPPGVISHLVHLEELYVIPSRFCYWEGDGQEEGRNTNLKEFESVSHLNTLEIMIKNNVVVPRLPRLGELKKYKVIQEDLYDTFRSRMDNRYKRQLMISEWNVDTPAGRVGIDTLLRSSDCLILKKGSNDLVQLLRRDGVDSLQSLKYLEIEDCDTPECLANTINRVHQPPNATVVFPILEKLSLKGPHNLREICRGPVSRGSFEQLTEINIHGCERLGHLFQLPIVGCFIQLKSLSIRLCEMMEEVFIWKEQQEDVHVATDNRIEFPKLETLELVGLPSLVGFCRGIEQIDLPQLKELRLQYLRKVNRLFHNNDMSSNSEQNDNVVSFFSFFPEKVTFPRLEYLELEGCESLVYIFQPSMARVLVNLQELIIDDCSKMEAVVDGEQEIEDGQGRKSTGKTQFPHLSKLELRRLPKLKRFCHFRYPLELPLLSQMVIWDCPIMDSFSLGYVHAPNLSLQGISRNGKIWRLHNSDESEG